MAVPLSEIPTLSLLYKLNRIPPDEDADEPQHQPNATYNDRVSVIRQDITTLEVDAIVNAANGSLLGGGGVDGAIHRAAGPELYDECVTLDGCETGSAKITDGYQLPAKKVIHAVGPIYWKTKREGQHTALLSGCYRTSLELAVENGLRSIAFSALSTGMYGYPSGEASEVALETVRKFLEEGKGDEMERIIFCNFMPKDEDAYFENIPTYFPPVAEAEKTEPAATSTDEAELAAKLPDAPAADPKDPEEPSAKKQKTEAIEDDFVVVDKEETKAAEAVVPKADL
ncbi:macro domain-like protein [Lentithecium fluviatile CBS 122367]|uniref:Macro domain-like protein n=1 Tax=Lentithecium fluviatile CBS 122367 TaxID=1168545 RepID=A0A6G1IL53_9PLEO|nr:macro domain-like protein [Lentithecium fluviatile CBS 122367]